MPKTRSIRLKGELSEQTLAYTLLTPAFIALTVVFIYPLLCTFYFSFSIIHPDYGVGNYFGSNYIRAFQDVAIWKSMSRTASFAIISVSLELSFGLAFALILNETFKFRGAMRALLLVPWALLTIANGQMWKWIFDGKSGVLNRLLTDWGLVADPVIWLGTNGWLAMGCAIVADVWKTTPFMTLLLLAGLQTIPDGIYEAGVVDGANSWQRFRNITLPLLKPTIMVALILRTIGAFKVYDIIYVLTGGGPANGTRVIIFDVIDQLFSFNDQGYGSAIAVIIFLVIFAFVVIYLRALRKGVDY
jgi:trehalose/maltose transport system permease protein